MPELIGDAPLATLLIADDGQGGSPALTLPFIPGPGVLLGGGFQRLDLAEQQLAAVAINDYAL